MCEIWFHNLFLVLLYSNFNDCIHLPFGFKKKSRPSLYTDPRTAAFIWSSATSLWRRKQPGGLIIRRQSHYYGRPGLLRMYQVLCPFAGDYDCWTWWKRLLILKKAQVSKSPRTISQQKCSHWKCSPQFSSNIGEVRSAVVINLWHFKSPFHYSDGSG